MYRKIIPGVVMILLLLVAAPAWAQSTEEIESAAGAEPLAYSSSTGVPVPLAQDGVTIIWSGTVKFDPYGNLTLIPVNTGTPLEINRDTPLGALEAASTPGNFTYDIWKAEWGIMVYRVNDIPVEVTDDGELYRWWFHDVWDGYITNNATFKSLSDGERIQLVYAPDRETYNEIIANKKYLIDMVVDFPDDDLKADFTAEPIVGAAPLTVRFTDISTVKNVTAWLWDFGVDNATSDEQNPVYTYEEPALYTVSLTVTNDTGADETVVKEDYIDVWDSRLSIYETVAADSNLTRLVNGLNITGLDAMLDEPGTYTVFAPTDDAIDALPPEIIDAMLNDTEAFTEVLLYCMAGEIYMKADLILMDEVETLQGQSLAITWDEANQTLMVNDATVIVADIECSNGVIHIIDTALMPAEEPEANFTADVTEGYAPLTVQFTDTSEIDNITYWWWDFGNGYMCTLEDPLFTYHTPGVFNVSLTVIDDEDNVWTVTKEGFINVTAPIVPEANFTADVTEGYAPLTVLFTDTSTVENVVAWAWDFGDGGTSTEQHPWYAYETPGTYTVSLSVTDDTNTTYSVTKPDYIIVLEEEQYADFEANVTEGAAPLAVAFTDTSMVKNITSWSWEFGDGYTAEEQNPVHVYTENGTYDVRLTINREQNTYYWRVRYGYILVG